MDLDILENKEGEKIQISELEGKEVVNLYDGASLGRIEQTELLINPQTGCIESLVIPPPGGVFDLFESEEPLVIPWEAVVKIGAEIVIVDFAPGQRKNE